jgi:lysophospholipase L1-like esterase
MRKNLIYKLVLLGTIIFGLLYSLPFYAQDSRPFWSEIKSFQKQDETSKPAKNGIVFYGSSSIRKWVNAELNFKDYQVINRGFGGSTLAQATDYLNFLVFPYQPREVVIYSGENDIAMDHTSANETISRLKTLVAKLRAGLPNVPIVFLSIKQSPSRAQFGQIVLQANSGIKSYLATLSKATYLDVNSKMLNAQGGMRPELFEADMLHMKPAGYAIWEKELRPYLIKSQ